MIRSGSDVVDVKDAMGHASTETTHSTYVHLWPDSSERVRNGMAALIEWTLTAD